MLTFYTIKNLDNGMYLSGVPQSAGQIQSYWTNNTGSVKVYQKPGPARSAMTTISRLCYDADIPKPNIALVQLDTIEVILDDSERVAGAIQKIRQKKQKRQDNYKKWQIDALHRQMAEAAKRLKDLEHDVQPL